VSKWASSGLDQTPRDLHDAIVSRVISFALALIIALWLPVRCTAAAGRWTKTPLPAAGMAQTGQLPNAGEPGPRMIAGTGGSWQARLAHDAFTSESWPTGVAVSRILVPAPANWLSLRHSYPIRTFPLLI
jgi:hypothetical protein